MARRILSAESILVPQAQAVLPGSVRTESRSNLFQALQERWLRILAGRGLFFDWEDRRELMAEIQFVNRAQATLDEAAVKIAPLLLRIILTVQRNLPEAKAQRTFLAEHLQLDFRRISELCIVADSYGLLETSRRREGEREISRYGWSNALKLAYVRDPADRRDIWERARGRNPAASYRAILEEIRRFWERKMLAPPTSRREFENRMDHLGQALSAFRASAKRVETTEDCKALLKDVTGLRRELGRIKEALQDQIDAATVEELAATA